MGPAADQIELLIFGPGYGESCVIHIGAANWIIVDSCINMETARPAALEYLESISVDYESDVKLIIATHWHDDHVRGISEIVKKCKAAQFCSSSALTAKEFIAVAHLYANKTLIRSSSGVSEMYSILDHLREKSLSPKRAVPDRLIYKLAAQDSGHGLGCEIWTLSPSDHQVTTFLQDITALMPGIKSPKKRIPDRNQNHMTVVTWLTFGELAMLLGGDLEQATDDRLGWHSIVYSRTRPSGRARFFKLAHHGSQNAHSDDLWETMVESNCFAVVTPYSRGRILLPTKNDIDRIKKNTDSGFITSATSHKGIRPRLREIEKMISRSSVSLRPAEPKSGYVRFRNGGRSNPTNWTIVTGNGACKLTDIPVGSPFFTNP